MRVLWFVVLGSGAALAVFLARGELFGEAPAPASAPAKPAAPVARPQRPSSFAARSPQKEATDALRARLSTLPAFADLPGSDQAWVLAQARARLSDPNSPELVPLVQQLAEVRMFAVSEREEPLPTPTPDLPEVH